MTDSVSESRRDELSRKIVRVHSLRDPLGAKGQRRTADRIDRETRARRGVFTAALAAFVVCFGVLTLTGDKPDGATSTTGPRIIAEIPGNGERGTAPRILEALPTQIPRPHVRTRATS